MNKSKKIVVISLVCIMVIVITTVAFVGFINSILPKTYSSAKKECEKIFDNYQVQMTEIAVDSLKSGKNVSGKFKEYFYICYQETGIVKFDIDAQGMLGGQYWELVYTKDGTFYGEAKSYLYKEAGGNNIMKAERLDENWWFLWTDYDGTDRSYH